MKIHMAVNVAPTPEHPQGGTSALCSEIGKLLTGRMSRWTSRPALVTCKACKLRYEEQKAAEADLP